ncbi:MAG: nitroreductase [Thermoleophilia bacterium]|nr:nitroreductase [Thermoleophilia bacterium]
MQVDAVLALKPEFARSPSAHNTQPWVLTRDPDDPNSLLLSWQEDRTLPVADPAMRDNFLGLGAYVETVLTVTAEADITLRFEPDIDVLRRCAGRFSDAGDARHQTPFTSADIASRGCSRIKYEEGCIAPDDLAAVDQHARQARGSIAHISSRTLITTLVDADRHMWRDAAVTAELRSWLRLSKRHPNYHRDGLTYEALAMAASEAAALKVMASPPVYATLRPLGLPSLLASFSKPLLDYDGSVLVLMGPAGPPVGSVEAHELELRMGQVLMRTWLELNARGLSVHPLSQIIDAPDTYAALHGLIEAGDDDRLFAIFRVGRSQGPPVRSSRIAETTSGSPIA